MSLSSRLIVSVLPLIPRLLVGKVARRYVAGETVESAVATVRRINGEGAMATLDILGEEVERRETALAAVEAYCGLFDTIRESDLDANVSVKLTALGLKIDETFCRENVERILKVASGHRNFVRIDMEDRTCTDATLRIYHELQARYGNVGIVLQAYMRRLQDDIAALPASGANVRLCKGIYLEPRRVAWKGRETIRRSFEAGLEALFERQAYVGIATHDEYLVCAADSLIRRLGIPPERYEYQMLLGVDEELRRILLERGHRLRVYVPYGPDWYRYSLRRLRENPEIALHVTRAFLGLG